MSASCIQVDDRGIDSLPADLRDNAHTKQAVTADAHYQCESHLMSACQLPTRCVLAVCFHQKQLLDCNANMHYISTLTLGG